MERKMIKTTKNCKEKAKMEEKTKVSIEEKQEMEDTFNEQDSINETIKFTKLIDQIGKEHKAIVRIKKVTLDNFKNVEHGEIVLNCGREFVPCETESDILGIYGQNGSGKTAFVEALAILQALMRGGPVDDAYADCVAIGKECANLEFVFDIQYPNDIIREATYSFCLGSKPRNKEEIAEKYKYSYEMPEKANKVIVYNEKFSLIWESASKRQLIIDTSSNNVPFTPDTKRKELVGGGKEDLAEMKVRKQLAKETSRSFVFMESTFKMFNKKDPDAKNSIPFKVLIDLRYYARKYLYVIDTKSAGLIRLNFAMPVYTKKRRLYFKTINKTLIPIKEINEVKMDVEHISFVLNQLVPGLTIKLKEYDNIKDSVETGLVAYRDGIELPLRYESDGIRKIISVLALIIEAFNQPSATVAIDEFDAGIFEYLLGEILQALEESGLGQFIFTSHNLRPLEVINKKFLYFTTTNPKNRYIRLKNISATNNLRDTYFREIVMSEQEEEIYNKTKRFKMIAALKKVGEE